MVEQLRIPAMKSRQDMERIATALRAVKGVGVVRFFPAQSIVVVEHNDDTSLSKLIEAIRGAGYHEVAVLV